MFACVYNDEPRKIILYNAKENTGFDPGKFVREVELRDGGNGKEGYYSALFSEGYLIGYDGNGEKDHLKVIHVSGKTYSLSLEKGETLYYYLMHAGGIAGNTQIMPIDSKKMLTQCKNGKFSFRGVEYILNDLISD